MNLIAIDKVKFMLENRSQSYVSEQTGIPASTLSYVARGLRDIPSQYLTGTQRAYNRESYSRMRDTGVPIYDSKQFRGASLTNVRDVISRVDKLVDTFTRQHISAFEISIGNRLPPDMYQPKYEAIAKNIRAAVKRSSRALSDNEKGNVDTGTGLSYVN